MPGASISYIDAWVYWFTKGPVAPQALLFGLPIYWWSRIGKLLALIGGSVAILDILSEKNREFAAKASARLLTNFLAWASSICISALLVYIELVVGFETMVENTPALIAWLILAGFAALVLSVGLAVEVEKSLRRRAESNSASIVRSLGLALVIVGFHFDILGS